MSLHDITTELMTVLMRSADAEYAAAALLQFKKDVRTELLGDEINPSSMVLDAQAYRSLADSISATMTDPDRWDGDDDEGTILARYVEWLAAERATVRAEVLREAAEVSAQWNSDCQSCAVELEVATELHRLADETAPPTDLTIYRASHDSIVMGLYTTVAAAREHCETEERRSWPTGTNLAFVWIEDAEDGVAELSVVAGQNEGGVTGYVVTALTVASKYDEEADE